METENSLVHSVEEFIRRKIKGVRALYGSGFYIGNVGGKSGICREGICKKNLCLLN
jgi:hypothetical protein